MRNKKAFIPVLAAGAMAVLVVGIIIAIVLMMIFTSLKWNLVVGGGVIVMTFIYAVPALLQGDFNKGKVIFVGILFFSGIVLILAPQMGIMQETLGSEIYLPSYGELRCELKDSNYLLYSKSNFADATTVTCGKDMKAYTNYCDFRLKITPSSWLSKTGLCQKYSTEYRCNSAGDCQEIKTISISNVYQSVYTVRLDANGDGYIDSADSGVYSTFKTIPYQGALCKFNLDLEVVGNAYKLEDNQPNGYGTDFNEGCNLLNINPLAHVVKKEFVKFNYQQAQNQVPFGGRIFYVWGLQKALTDNVIMHEGKQVYVQKAGCVMPILTAQDGFKYADYRTEDCSHTDIECTPASIYYCNADGTLRKTPSQDVTGQSCSILRGVPANNFLKASETECCKFKCVNNIAEKYECETCAICKEGEAYNQENNVCVKVSDTGVSSENLNCKLWETEKEYTTTTYKWYNYIGIGSPSQETGKKCVVSSLVWILGAVFILFLIIIVLLLTPKSKKKKRK